MPDIRFLETVAIECGRIILDEKARGFATADKVDQIGAHFATNSDFKSEQRAMELLSQEYPDEVLIGEEQSESEEIPPNCTVIDPTDGTTLHFNGGTQYGFTACTLRDGQPEMGVMYWPEDQALISAVRGRGCRRGGFGKGKRLSIPQWHGQRDKMLVATDIGPWTAWEVLQPIAAKHPVVSYMVAVYGARAVLEGVAAFYYNLNIAKAWDVAAGALSIQEAGGVALDPHGHPLQWNRRRMDWFYARDAEMAEYALEFLKNWQPR